MFETRFDYGNDRRCKIADKYYEGESISLTLLKRVSIEVSVLALLHKFLFVPFRQFGFGTLPRAIVTNFMLKPRKLTQRAFFF